MASIGYEYDPDSDIDSETFSYENKDEEEEICFSTKLEDLDKIDLINRNSDNNQIPTPDNLFPDPLSKKPLYTKVIPKGGIYGEPPKEPFLNDGIIKESTMSPEELTRITNEKREKEYERSKLKNMSIEQFIKFIAKSYIDILNDISEMSNISEIYDIFTKNDRLISIGVLMLSISIFFIFFQNLTF